MNLQFCRSDACYAPGDRLTCTWQMAGAVPVALSGMELSVLWYTEGKGDEDLGVHHFRRISGPQLERMDLRQPHRLITQLPATPLSYDGHLLRIRWCVRLRLFLDAGREVVAQQPFRLTTRHA